ncbi:hypothetical protein JCM10296v2_006828 [Rhodotorula toruloides]
MPGPTLDPIHAIVTDHVRILALDVGDFPSEWKRYENHADPSIAALASLANRPIISPGFVYHEVQKGRGGFVECVNKFMNDQGYTNGHRWHNIRAYWKRVDAEFHEDNSAAEAEELLALEFGGKSVSSIYSDRDRIVGRFLLQRHLEFTRMDWPTLERVWCDNNWQAAKPEYDDRIMIVPLLATATTLENGMLAHTRRNFWAQVYRHYCINIQNGGGTAYSRETSFGRVNAWAKERKERARNGGAKREGTVPWSAGEKDTLIAFLMETTPSTRDYDVLANKMQASLEAEGVTGVRRRTDQSISLWGDFVRVFGESMTSKHGGVEGIQQTIEEARAAAEAAKQEEPADEPEPLQFVYEGKQSFLAAQNGSAAVDEAPVAGPGPRTEAMLKTFKKKKRATDKIRPVGVAKAPKLTRAPQQRTAHAPKVGKIQPDAQGTAQPAAPDSFAAGSMSDLEAKVEEDMYEDQGRHDSIDVRMYEDEYGTDYSVERDISTVTSAKKAGKRRLIVSSDDEDVSDNTRRQKASAAASQPTSGGAIGGNCDNAFEA